MTTWGTVPPCSRDHRPHQVRRDGEPDPHGRSRSASRTNDVTTIGKPREKKNSVPVSIKLTVGEAQDLDRLVLLRQRYVTEAARYQANKVKRPPETRASTIAFLIWSASCRMAQGTVLFGFATPESSETK